MSQPSITDLEKHFVNRALSKADIGVGDYIEQFENAWTKWNGMKYGVSCNSGTNAIYLALKALGIGPGDEVIVPEYTMIATAWAVTYTGATPVFVDCDDKLGMDLEKLEATIAKRNPKAVIITPIYGRMPSLPINDDCYLIGDYAEAHGLDISFLDIACYSFYGNKILTTGEGGMCLTNNQKWADEMRKYSNMYFDEKRTYLHPKVGHNFRMTNLQAAVGLAQVMRIDEILAKRKQVETWYDQYMPEKYKMPKREVLWFYDIQTDKQEALKQHLELNGVPARYGFKPMSMQPMYLGEYEHLNAYKWSKRILYLPTWTDMSEEDVKYVCQKVQSSDEE